MIIAEQKSLQEIQAMISPYEKILLVGCGTCVSFCSAGGAKEVDALAEMILAERRKDGRTLFVERNMMPRQCSTKFIERIEKKVEAVEAILDGRTDPYTACDELIRSSLASDGGQHVK